MSFVLAALARSAAAAALGASLLACAAPVPSVNTPSMQSLLPTLLDDAARRSAVPATRLRVVAMEAVVWRDGALGCPQPGRLYPQVLTPGHRVRIAPIEGGEGALDYHVSDRGGWLHCPAGQAQPPLSREADPRI